MATASKWIADGSTKESVWKYPRPPALEKTDKHLRVVWNNDGKEIVLADTRNAYRVLETSHPPTYYIPPGDCDLSQLQMNARHTFCEWKGSASYYDAGSVKSRIWTYQQPSSRFKEIRDYLSFYVGPWRCYVDDEEVVAQPGDFYGGWMTSDVDGGSRGVKGGPGSWGW